MYRLIFLRIRSYLAFKNWNIYVIFVQIQCILKNNAFKWCDCNFKNGLQEVGKNSYYVQKILEIQTCLDRNWGVI